MGFLPNGEWLAVDDIKQVKTCGSVAYIFGRLTQLSQQTTPASTSRQDCPKAFETTRIYRPSEESSRYRMIMKVLGRRRKSPRKSRDTSNVPDIMQGRQNPGIHFITVFRISTDIVQHLPQKQLHSQTSHSISYSSYSTRLATDVWDLSAWASPAKHSTPFTESFMDRYLFRRLKTYTEAVSTETLTSSLWYSFCGNGQA